MARSTRVMKVVAKGRRNFDIGPDDISIEDRTLKVSFSSEYPVARWLGDELGYGEEILDHAAGSVDMEFLSGGRAPVLKDHWTRDQIGVIDEANIGSDLRGHAVLRFSRAEDAEVIFQDVIDEIRGNISVGYQIKEIQLESKGENELDVYRVTEWFPYEISMVSIPADPSVGVGRSHEQAPEMELLEVVVRGLDEQSNSVIDGKGNRSMEYDAQGNLILRDTDGNITSRIKPGEPGFVTPPGLVRATEVVALDASDGAAGDSAIRGVVGNMLDERAETAERNRAQAAETAAATAVEIRSIAQAANRGADGERAIVAGLNAEQFRVMAVQSGGGGAFSWARRW